MKNKFHLNKRLAGRHAQAGLHGAVAEPAKAVALVDERFLLWLASQSGLPETASLQRSVLMPVLSEVLVQSGADSSLLRTYSYSDRSFVAGVADGVLVRTVPAHAQDGGLGLVRAMGQELLQIAQRAGCGVALIASDDERLMPYIDEAQWRGLTVVLLTDTQSLDLSQLMASDPSWARLLAQADRRLVLETPHLQALVGQADAAGFLHARATMDRLATEDLPAVPNAQGHDFESEDPAAWRARVEDVIRQWWDEETPDARQDLQDEMQYSQGVPADTDRLLLLRVRRALARPLSFQEKKLMREMIRATVYASAPLEGRCASDAD